MDFKKLLMTDWVNWHKFLLNAAVPKNSNNTKISEIILNTSQNLIHIFIFF